MPRPDFSFSLADGESFSASIPASTQCSLAETDSQGATGVSGEFSNQLLTASGSFTVTNNYHEDEPEVLGTNITKTLTSADPAAVGEDVIFDVAVSFVGTVLPNAELTDTYEPQFIEFVSASVGGVPLACQTFPVNGTLGMVACDLGDVSSPVTVQLRFVTVAPTLPRRTLDTAEVTFDVDGAGPLPPEAIGPVSDDVEIVEALALAPLGNDRAGGSPSGSLAAALAATAAVALGAGVVLRRRRVARREDRAA